NTKEKSSFFLLPGRDARSDWWKRADRPEKPKKRLTSSARGLIGQSFVLTAEDVSVQEVIAELPLRIVLPAQLYKRRHLLVNTFQFCRRGCKQFSPVRPRAKRG